uniref:Uncharacterized protein n=1 Tax=Vespula pensylvanica TaxID=30213 RepID=A0A834K651_VESPE|nr:hypothetical protein H0235_015874 [Vespula pensylvanica]
MRFESRFDYRKDKKNKKRKLVVILDDDDVDADADDDDDDDDEDDEGSNAAFENLHRAYRLVHEESGQIMKHEKLLRISIYYISIFNCWKKLLAPTTAVVVAAAVAQRDSS